MASTQSFVGTWKLLSCKHRRDDGTVEFPFGRRPKGRLIYTAIGQMIVLITDPARPAARSPQFFEATTNELAAAAQGCVAYSGQWVIRDGEVIHAIDQSLFPNWSGNRLVRIYKINRKRLTLGTAPFLINKLKYTAELEWERET